jgi:acyl dehydratase
MSDLENTAIELREKFLISQNLITLFADVGGDPNPIHQSKEAAQLMGLPGPIAHGMYVYSFLLHRLDHWINKTYEKTSVKWVLKTTRCRFHEPAIIGHTFEAIVKVAEQKENEAKVHLTLQSETGAKLTHIVAQLHRQV